MTEQVADPVEDPENEALDDDPGAALLKKHGVSSFEELDERLEKERVANKSFAQMRNRLENAERELRELRDAQEDSTLGVGEGTDPVVKNLTREVRELRATIGEMLLTPEDKANDALYQEVLNEHPEIKSIRNPVLRIKTARRLALGIEAERKQSGQGNGVPDTAARRNTTISRTFVERGGTSTLTPGGRESEDEALKRYERKRKAAGSDKDKIDKVDKEFRAKYPHWGI